MKRTKREQEIINTLNKMILSTSKEMTACHTAGLNEAHSNYAIRVGVIASIRDWISTRDTEHVEVYL